MSAPVVVVAPPRSATSPRATRARLWLTSPAGGLALVLLAGASLRIWMLAHGVPMLDSDEATFGLMALHVPRGDWSAFMWGQPYMGTLEAFLIAPFLVIFGATAFALRLGPLMLSLAALATTYLLAVRIYSRRVGLYSVALLAVGSPFFVVLTLRAYGGYVETVFFGTLLLLLALPRARVSHSRRGRVGVAALAGLIAGLALWTDLLVVPYLLVAGLLCWWQGRASLRSLAGVACGVGLLAGAAPAILYNATHGAPTLNSVLALTVAGSRGHSASTSMLSLLPRNIWLEATVSLPILTSGFLGGTQGTGLTTSAYLRQASAHPLVYAVALTLALGAVALSVSAVPHALRESRDTPPLRRYGARALLVLGACYASAFALSSQPDIFATPRYLLPLFTMTPLLVAQAGAALAAVRRRYAFRVPFASSRWLAPLLVVILCGWNLAGDVALTPLQTAALDHGIWVTSDDASLVRIFAADQVHTVISNDYWEGMRLTFASGETILNVMMTPQGHPGFNRYPNYVSAGLADPRPAYLELTGTAEADRDIARFRQGYYFHYSLREVGEYTVLLPPPSG